MNVSHGRSLLSVVSTVGEHGLVKHVSEPSSLLLSIPLKGRINAETVYGKDKRQGDLQSGKGMQMGVKWNITHDYKTLEHFIT